MAKIEDLLAEIVNDPAKFESMTDDELRAYFADVIKLEPRPLATALNEEPEKLKKPKKKTLLQEIQEELQKEMDL